MGISAVLQLLSVLLTNIIWTRPVPSKHPAIRPFAQQVLLTLQVLVQGTLRMIDIGRLRTEFLIFVICRLLPHRVANEVAQTKSVILKNLMVLSFKQIRVLMLRRERNNAQVCNVLAA